MNQEFQGDPMVWLRRLRHHMIQVLLQSILLLGGFGILYSVYRILLGKGDPPTLGPYIAAYLLLLALYLIRAIPDDLRAVGVLAIVYGFAVFSFYSAWLASGGRVFLLSFIMLTAVLLSPRAGFVAAALSLLTYIGFGLAFANGWLKLRPLASPVALPPIITEGIGFALAVGITWVALWLIRQGLVAATRANQEADQARALLAQRAQELDKANQMLMDQTHSLEAANQLLEAQMWQTIGQSQLDDALRGEQEVMILADRAIRQICRYVEAQAGALYLWDGAYYQMVGKYAYPAQRQPRPCFRKGEGLLGQAALEGRMKILSPVPAGDLVISSGLGEAPPDSLVISPFEYNGLSLGVIELGKFGAFSPAQIDFLKSAMDKIGVALSTAQTRAQMLAWRAESQPPALLARDPGIPSTENRPDDPHD